MLHVNENFEKQINEAEIALGPWFSRGLTKYIYGNLAIPRAKLFSLAGNHDS